MYVHHTVRCRLQLEYVNGGDEFAILQFVSHILPEIFIKQRGSVWACNNKYSKWTRQDACNISWRKPS